MYSQLLISFIVIPFLSFFLKISSLALMIFIRLLYMLLAALLECSTDAQPFEPATSAQLNGGPQKPDSDLVDSSPSQLESSTLFATDSLPSSAGPRRTAEVHSATSLQAEMPLSSPSADRTSQEDASASARPEPNAPRSSTPPPAYGTPSAPAQPSRLDDPLADLVAIFPAASRAGFTFQGFHTTGNARVHYPTMIYGGCNNRGAEVRLERQSELCT
ncbi:hypothetical protein CONPUDRAFT_144201 [Coniophora puteana RWD-64-598 SS2]|uniref:Uncharacterized protein n=1 Tax=Coniophora puteana (strain RWD-64-598) TaxID=741705 RepID=A0A5M3MSB4_CONPW|nr:uncharacterized protein CONPUDRAFT_144201 [Coniophora puteana RWD-64-598 SS2]EIW81421.1 hypothetical protein CONPUDRAFT_144201 [Coniophora puteana RWD-64-598 SS2]